MNKVMSNLQPETLKHMTEENKVPSSPPKDPAAGGQKPGNPAKPQLSVADVQMIHRFLMSQEEGLARRSDLSELHKRIVQMMQTLSQAVGETIAKRNAESREKLTARIETLEDAVNRMEGALRIEFEPVLRKTISDVVAEQAKPKRRVGRQLFWTGAVLSVGLVLGVTFHPELSGFVKQIVSKMETTPR